MINKDRLIAITDGIIAIAATIMVLTLVAPDKASFAEIEQRLPTLIAYAISYMQIFLAWHEHHDAFADMKIINHRIFLINCVWLFFVTLLPFATATVGVSYNDAFSVRLYIFILFCIDLMIKIECDFIVKFNKKDIRDSAIIHLLRKLTMIGYALALIATFFMPAVAMGIIIVEYILNLILMWRNDIRLSKAAMEDC